MSKKIVVNGCQLKPRRELWLEDSYEMQLVFPDRENKKVNTQVKRKLDKKDLSAAG